MCCEAFSGTYAYTIPRRVLNLSANGTTQIRTHRRCPPTLSGNLNRQLSQGLLPPRNTRYLQRPHSSPRIIPTPHSTRVCDIGPSRALHNPARDGLRSGYRTPGRRHREKLILPLGSLPRRFDGLRRVFCGTMYNINPPRRRTASISNRGSRSRKSSRRTAATNDLRSQSTGSSGLLMVSAPIRRVTRPSPTGPREPDERNSNSSC